MAQHYSDRKRESSPYSLPDVETFHATFRYCMHCGSLVLMDYDEVCGECAADGTEEKPEDIRRGWFYWFCFPGCMPDSEPMGPFNTEDEAIEDARDGCDDYDEDSDEDGDTL